MLRPPPRTIREVVIRSQKKRLNASGVENTSFHYLNQASHLVESASKTAYSVTIEGTSEAYSTLSIYDKNALLGTAKPLFWVPPIRFIPLLPTQWDRAGNIGNVSNDAILGTTKNDALRGFEQ